MDIDPAYKMDHSFDLELLITYSWYSLLAIYHSLTLPVMDILTDELIKSLINCFYFPVYDSCELVYRVIIMGILEAYPDAKDTVLFVFRSLGLMFTYSSNFCIVLYRNKRKLDQPLDM